MKHVNPARFFVLLCACTLLSGCGGGSDTPTATHYRAIHVSTNDCAKDSHFSFDICVKAIKSAIESHNQFSPIYASLRACTATEGQGRCERDVNRKYRPRLVAYLIEATEPPAGYPLYPTLGGEPGFRDAANVNYLEDDLTLEFSKRARSEFAKYIKTGKAKALF